MKPATWIALLLMFCLVPAAPALAEKDIIHDGEYNYLKAQHGKKWARLNFYSILGETGERQGFAREKNIVACDDIVKCDSQMRRLFSVCAVAAGCPAFASGPGGYWG